MWPGVGGEAERTVLDCFLRAGTSLKGVAGARSQLRKKLDEDCVPTDPEIKRIRREAEPNKIVRLRRNT